MKRDHEKSDPVADDAKTPIRQGADSIEVVDQFVAGEMRWTVTLRDHGPRGIEVQFLRNDEFSHSFRWPTRELALEWAKQERRDLEKLA